MTRDQVLSACYGAKTLADVEFAITARDLWLAEHPNDEEVFHAGETLSKMRQGLHMQSDAARAGGQKVSLS